MTPRLLLLILGLFALRLLAYWLVDGLHASLAHDYCVWDCNWYLSVASNGYALSPTVTPGPTYGQANWAFFPLYPLLVHLTALLLPVSTFAAGFITANGFLLLFVFVAVSYLPRRRKGVSRAGLAAFLLAFPYGVYFSLAYTEALFAFLATAALLSLTVERLTLAAGFSGLVSATRVPGILFTPIVVLRASAPVFAAWRKRNHRRAFACAKDALLPIALAPLGLFLFMAYLYAHMGDALAFAHIQAGWARQSTSPFATLYNNRFASDWSRAFTKTGQSAAVNEYASLAGLALCVRLGFLRLWPECWVLGGTILLALSAGLVSMERYVLANPVFLIFLFDWIWQSAMIRRFFVPLLMACAALQLYFAHCWLGAYGFLM